MKVLENVWFGMLPGSTPHHLSEEYFYAGMNRKQKTPFKTNNLIDVHTFKKKMIAVQLRI